MFIFLVFIYILFRHRILRNRSDLQNYVQHAARPQTTDSYTLWHTFGRQQSCTAHDAAQATVLACTQCCPGHENTSKLSCESALPGPQCCTAHTAARATALHCPQELPRPQCWHAHNAAKAAVLHCPQCSTATSQRVPLGHDHTSHVPGWGHMHS